MTDSSKHVELRMEQVAESIYGNHVVGMWSGGLILEASSHSGLSELIFEVAHSEGDRSNGKVAALGFEASLKELDLAGQRASCFVLSQARLKFSGPFSALSEYLKTQFLGDFSLKGSAEELFESVDRWFEFFRRSKGMSRKEQIQGLVGELLAMDSVLDCSNLEFDEWTGPIGSPQDFRIGSTWIEVKTSSARKGALVHKISSVDQLVIPEGGQLYVLSFRLQLGKQAQHSVHDLVNRVGASPLFSDREAQTYFRQALSSVGYDPDLPEDLSKYDLFETALFDIREDFPRLQRSDLPNDIRIMDVSYSVDFSATGDFAVDLGGQHLYVEK